MYHSTIAKKIDQRRSKATLMDICALCVDTINWINLYFRSIACRSTKASKSSKTGKAAPTDLYKTPITSFAQNINKSKWSALWHSYNSVVLLDCPTGEIFINNDLTNYELNVLCNFYEFFFPLFNPININFLKATRYDPLKMTHMSISGQADALHNWKIMPLQNVK